MFRISKFCELLNTTEQRNIEQPIPYFSKSKQSDDYVTDF